MTTTAPALSVFRRGHEMPGMPRVIMTKRTPYRPDQGLQLARIEERRLKLGVEHQDLALAADLALATYRRIRARGRASQAQVTALRFALRTLEQKRRLGALMFDQAAEDGNG